jgi:hypothetical protein
MPHEELAQRLTSAQDIQSLVGNLSAEVDQRGFATGGHHDNHTMAVVEVNMNSILKEKMDKLTRMIVGVLGVLLAVSLLFNILQLRSGSNNADFQELQALLDEKNQQIAQMENSLQLYNDIKEKGSKELITRVEVLEYEKASLLEYIDSLMNKVDKLEQKVAEATAPVKSKDNSKGKTNNVSAQETAQRIVNRLASMKEVSGKDFAQTMGKKAQYRNEILVLLVDLNKKTGQKHKSTIDGVVRELKDPQSLAMKVGQNQERVYISTMPASKKIDQLAEKIKKIKSQI